MGYFNYLPNISLATRPIRFPWSSQQYETAKNIFRRFKIADAALDSLLYYKRYTVTDSDRPDLIAEKIYGDSDYDWVIMLANNIINPYFDWPMSSPVLEDYIANKYEKPFDIKHYTTNEVKNANGDVVLPANQLVGEDFYKAPFWTNYDEPLEDAPEPVNSLDFEANRQYTVTSATVRQTSSGFETQPYFDAGSPSAPNGEFPIFPAEWSANLSNTGYLKRFEVTNGGSNYTYPPIVTLGGGMANESATAVIENGVVTEVQLDGTRFDTTDDTNIYQFGGGATIAPNGTGIGSWGGFNVGSTHLRLGDSWGERYATLKKVDMTNFDTVRVYAIRGNGMNGGETPDIAGVEELRLRYQFPTDLVYNGAVGGEYIQWQMLETGTFHYTNDVEQYMSGLIEVWDGPNNDGTGNWGPTVFYVDIQPGIANVGGGNNWVWVLAEGGAGGDRHDTLNISQRGPANATLRYFKGDTVVFNIQSGTTNGLWMKTQAGTGTDNQVQWLDPNNWTTLGVVIPATPNGTGSGNLEPYDFTVPPEVRVDNVHFQLQQPGNSGPSYDHFGFTTINFINNDAYYTDSTITFTNNSLDTTGSGAEAVVYLGKSIESITIDNPGSYTAAMENLVFGYWPPYGGHGNPGTREYYPSWSLTGGAYLDALIVVSETGPLFQVGEKVTFSNGAEGVITSYDARSGVYGDDGADVQLNLTAWDNNNPVTEGMLFVGENTGAKSVVRTFNSSEFTEPTYADNTLGNKFRYRLTREDGTTGWQKLVRDSFRYRENDGSIVTLQGSSIVNAITHHEYETRLNDEKRKIYVLREQYLLQFIEEMKAQLPYKESSDFISVSLKRSAV
tara:strand:+ start:9747 stop:12269 length:2523 start_codon:yes stop_codon:yes gene_type:complete